MALLASGLATAIKAQLGTPTSNTEIDVLSDAIVTEVKNGSAAGGSPAGNLISNIDGSQMASNAASNLGLAETPATLTDFYVAIATHITTSGTVTYTDSPAYVASGTIVGLNAATMANLIKAALGQT